MTKKIFALISILWIATSLWAQPLYYEWATGFSGTNEVIGRAVTEMYGWSYSTGVFWGTADFNPDPMAVDNHTSNGGSDIYLTLLNYNNGSPSWTITIGGIGYENVLSVTSDNASSVLITGNFEGTVDFDPGTGISNLTSNGASDIFIAKYDWYGNFVWAKSIGGNTSDVGTSLVVDLSNNIYLTGNYTGTVDFNPGIGLFNLTSNGETDMFICKLTQTGNFIWAKSMGGPYADEITSICVSYNNYLYTTGCFKDTVDFNPGTGVNNFASNGDADIFICTIDSAGNYSYAKTYGGIGFDCGYDIEISVFNNVFLCGSFSETMTTVVSSMLIPFSSDGGSDIFVARVGSSLDFDWIRPVGGSGDDVAYSMAFRYYNSPYENIYVTGSFNGSINSTSIPIPNYNNSNFSLISNGGSDIFIYRLNSDGDFLWGTNIGGPTNDMGKCITSDNSNVVSVTGTYNGTVDFNPGTATHNLSTTGSTSAFNLYFSVSQALSVDFSISDTEVYAGDSIHFMDLSEGYIINRLWDFGDGTYTALPNPSHVYPIPGIYTVSLVVHDTISSDTLTIINAIEVLDTLNAYFTASSTLISQGSAIEFTSVCAGNPTSWAWDFGDGMTSTLQNPIHVYQSGGQFTVSLTISDGVLTDNYTITNLITVLVTPGVNTGTGNIWYFGSYAGLSWNALTPGGDPTPLMDGQLNTNEGCASVCDNNANLLFYTDGRNVWDAQHQLMPNSLATSPGGLLTGNPSSTQSALIVPNPSNPDVYYIFSADANLGAGGLCFSKVDMGLNGGYGDIDTLEKNILLFYPTTEKITATAHANGNAYWVLTHHWNSNSFATYLVDSAGVQTSNPVISSVGSIHNNYSSNARGYMKFSIQGDKVAIGVEGGYYELFDFNNTTGVVSNPVLLTNPLFNACYGVEFSPNGQFLYGSERWGSDVWQWDLTTSNIPSSCTAIATLGSANGGALQLAPDGKIYLARNNTKYVGRINQPNQPGLLSNYVDQAVLLGPDYISAKDSKEGLPNLIKQLQVPELLANFYTSDTIAEIGDTIYFTDLTTGIPTHWHWDFGDGTTDTLQFPVHSYLNPGIYSITLIAWNDNSTDTLMVQNHIEIFSSVQANFSVPSISVNLGDALQFTDLSTGNPISWQWDFGDGTADTVQNPLHIYQAEGIYLVTLEVANNISSDTFTYSNYIVVINPVNFNSVGCQLEWVIGAGGGTEDIGNIIVVDDNFNVYVSGKASGNMKIYNSGNDTIELTNSENFFLSKFDANGDLAWYTQMNAGGNWSQENSLCIDNNGNILNAGIYNDYISCTIGGSVVQLTAQGSAMFFSKIDPSGNIIWLKGLQGGSITSVTTDISNNIYITGTTFGNTDFDPSSSIYIPQAYGYGDIFIAKYDPNGNFIWVETMGGSGNEAANTIKVDNIGNIYTTGNFNVLCDFDPDSISNFNLTSNSGSDNIFISKLDSLGNFVWAKSIGGDYWDVANDLVLDDYGNIFITGTFSITGDFDPGPGVSNLYCGSYSAFFAKYNNDGNLIWAKNPQGTSGGTSSHISYSIQLDVTGNIYLAGRFYNNMDADCDSLSEYSLNSYGFNDIFISKYDTIGDILWARNFGGANSDEGRSVAVDLAGNVYSTGFYLEIADFDPGPDVSNLTSINGKDMYVMKLNQVDAVYAGFFASDTIARPGDSIQFTDNSFGNISNWFWDFGDGTTSVDPDPTHVYTSFGSYTVSLIISNSTRSDTLVLNDYIVIYDKAVANFTASDTIVSPNDSVLFTDQTIGGALSWIWDFGDGTGDTVQNPVHVYQNPGTYNVQLAVCDSLSSDTLIRNNYIWVYEEVVADFSTSDTFIYTGNNIQFTNLTSGDPSYWHWDFGDGTTSTVYNPFHNYQNAGIYSVVLQVSNLLYSDTLTLLNYITVKDSLKANFNLLNTTVYEGDTLHFMDLSEGEPLYWFWDFGDGTTSTDQNPTHTFQVAGEYSISLIVTNSLQADSIIKLNYVHVIEQVSYLNFEGAFQLGGTGWDYGTSAVDAEGNLYVTGDFSGTADFDPGTGVFNLSAVGGPDIFLAKYNPLGQLIWAKRIGGTATESGEDIAIDNLGNVYITGYFLGTVDFDPGSTVLDLSSNGLKDIFIAKFNPNGNLVWAKSFGGSSNDVGQSISLGGLGNVFATGYFEGIADFNPGPATLNLMSEGGRDIFICKLTDGGSFVWAKSMGGTGNDESNAIESDLTGNTYITGGFESTADFNPSSSVYNLASQGSKDIFIAKYNTLGNLVWAQGIGGSYSDEGNALGIDVSGNVYATGNFGGLADFDPDSTGTYTLNAQSPQAPFINKLNGNGQFVWAKHMSGPIGGAGRAISLDSVGNIYATGYFSGTMDFDPNLGTYIFSSNGSSDVYVSALNENGDFMWANSFGGIYNDNAHSISVDDNGSIVVTGEFYETVDFDPDTTQLLLTSAGGTDIFVLQFSQQLVANFIASETEVSIGDTIQFTDHTNRSPISWQWDFGDGSTSTVQNPVHVYQAQGFYTVSLIATDTAETDTVVKTNYITVGNPLIAQFSTSDIYIVLGNQIFFTDLSLGNVVSWLWDFGDGMTSTLQNPIHVYQSGGQYTVSLTVSNGIATDTFTLTSLITVQVSTGVNMSETNIWYFGSNAGLSWNTSTGGDPTPLMDGQVSTFEGCATQCDNSGNLLFYTDGQTVWNALHQPMSNSTNTSIGGALNGDPSSTQSAIIVPSPSNSDIYYLFTNDNNIGTDGLCYSKIDLSQNSGLGDVDTLEKNILLLTPCTEKLTATPHFNGSAYWVLAHHWDSNSFAAFLVDSAGVETANPVVSSVGIIHTATSGAARGSMKFSPQGNKIAVAVEGENSYELFDFNNSTGVVSNPIQFTNPNFNDCYGVEFSPNGQYLYGTERWGFDLWQWDLTATDIPVSCIAIATLGSNSGGALQLAKDGKIYLARNNTKYVGRINQPNQPGLLSNYVDQAVLLGPNLNEAKTSREGLPNLIKQLQVPELVANYYTSDTITEIGDTVHFIDLTTGIPTQWLWDFGDGTTDTVQFPIHVYQSPGTFSVTLFASNSNESDTIILLDYIFVPFPIEADFYASDTIVYPNAIIHFYDASTASPNYWHWDFGDGTTSNLQNPDHVYQNTGNYTVSLTVSNNFSTDSIEMINKIYVIPAGWYVSNTGINHIVLLPENAAITLLGNPVSVGDYIGVFYDSLGTPACAGYTIWNGTIGAITVWGSESGLTNGFAPGEAFKWKVYDVSAGSEYNALATYNTLAFPNTGFFAANGMSGISTLEGIGYPDWEFVTYTTQHFIHIDGNTPVTVAGSQIEPGDYIGIFYDSLGTKYCAGFTYWTGQNQVLIAYGNNPQTSVKDGFLFGEPFQWKIWKSSSSLEIDAIATYKVPPIFPNYSTFVTSGSSGLLSLEATGINYQYIDLPMGWSIFSSYMNAFNPDLNNLCSPFATEVIIAKDEDGQVFWPQWGLNAIGNILVGNGYQIKMASAQTMTVAGFAVEPENTPLVLEQGWSFLGYLRQSPAPMEAMLSPVVSYVKIVKNGAGQVYWPQFNLNLIGNMVSGQGYQINMLVPQVLTYPANSVIFTKSEIHHAQPHHFQKPNNTGNNMSLGIHTSDLDPGTEIGVFNQTGLLVGSAVVGGDFTAITLWGDDEMTPEIDGLMEGEAFLVRVYSNLQGLTNLEGLEWIEGDERFETNKIAVAQPVSSFGFDVSRFALFQNIPNPFTSETEISFYLPKDCAVEIEIFNLLGERIVETLHATSLPGKPTTFTKGHHSITFNSKNLPAGTYYYRLKTEGFEQTRKMVVIKK